MSALLPPARSGVPLLRYFSAEADPGRQPSGVSGLQSRNPQPTDPDLRPDGSLLRYFSPEAEPGRRASPDPRADLRAACSEFESIFLSLLYRQMRSTVPSGGILPRGAAADIFDSLWTQEISRLSARSSPLRIADALVAALSSPASEETPPALKLAAPPTEDIGGMPRRALPGRRPGSGWQPGLSPGTGASQRPAGSRAPANGGG